MWLFAVITALLAMLLFFYGLYRACLYIDDCIDPQPDVFPLGYYERTLQEEVG